MTSGYWICATPAGNAPLCATVIGVALGFPNTVASLVPQHSRELLPIAIGSALLLAAAATAAFAAARVMAGRHASEKPAV